MKKTGLIIVCILIVLMVGCAEQPKDIQIQINELNIQKASIQNQIANEQKKLDSLTAKKIQVAKEKGLAKYILVLELKQSHFSLDIGTHLKDSMNSVEFEIPVDKETYNAQTVGNKLLNKFRSGSLLIDGNIGDWVITVKDKKIYTK